jgi:primary-amine oxidase
MSNLSRCLRHVARVGLAAIAVLVLPALAEAQTPAPAQAGKDPASRPPHGVESPSAHDASRHPLDPLEPVEIERAVAALRRHERFTSGVRFVSIGPNEPAKEVVRTWRPGKPFPREAFAILLDRESGRGYEAIVDLLNGRVRRFEALPEGVQPPIMIDEFGECEEAVRKSPLFREAMKKRGVENLDLVMIDAWSAGHYGNEPPEDRGKRLVRALCWSRSEAHENGYAHPIENIVAVVDLNRKELVRLEDYGVVPVPSQPGNWAREYLPESRKDLKSLAVLQPEGPSFTLRGHELTWQKWSLRIGFHPREGLVLYTVSYDGRPILYRASIAEMIVPYADPKASSYHKNVFDVGEYGLGLMANSLRLGCDCLGTIRYLDAHVADGQGRVVSLQNAICVHEEDSGMLWKHTDWRTGLSEMRRSRRLTVSMIATLGNYDYGFYWYLYQDGSIQLEVKLTGIVNTTALRPGETPRYGTEVAPRLNAPFHQHYFNARLDVSVDGEENSLQEVNTRSQPDGPDNPFKSAFYTETTPLLNETAAQRDVHPLSARFWRVVNPGRRNRMGRPVAYRLLPGETTLPFARPDAPMRKRAGFLTHNLWATPFHPDERFPAGDYPNQNPNVEGLPKWTRADRDLDRRDLVLWYTFGQTHIPRPEDWPVMPVVSVGFRLVPDGFFDQNPALDVAAPSN